MIAEELCDTGAMMLKMQLWPQE